MAYHRYLNPRFLVLMPLVIILIAAVACGGDDATPVPRATSTPQPTPTPIDIGAIAKGLQDAVTQAVGEGVSAEDVQRIVAAAAGGGLTAADVQKIVEETAGEALTAADVQRIVARAAAETAGEALTAADVQRIVAETAGQGLTAADVQRIVREQAGEALSAADVEKIVAETAGQALSAEDVQSIVERAVEESAGEALNAEDVQQIVAKAVATPTPTPTAVPSLEWQQPAFVKDGKYGGVIPMQAIILRVQVDPHQQSGPLEPSVMSEFWNQLLTWDYKDRYRMVGDLVRDWSLNADGSYTFSLYEGAKFLDGETINADDVKYSMDRMVEEGEGIIRPATGQIRPYYESTEVIDERTVKINLKISGSPAFLEWLTVGNLKILGKHIGDAHPDPIELQEFLSNPDNINGSGPYMWKDHQEGVSFETQRNPNYWKEGLPFLDGYRQFIIRDRNKIFAAYRAEQVLMTSFVTGLGVRDSLQLAEELKGRLTVHFLGANATLDSLILNWEKPPFDNPLVRRAVYIGLDRLEWLKINNAGKGFLGTPLQAGTWMTPPHEVVGTWPGFRYVDKHTGEPILVPYGNPDAVKDPLDIVKAKALLAEAGYDEDNKLTVVHNAIDIPYHRDGAVILREQFKAIGINLEIKLISSTANRAETRDKNFHMTAFSRDAPLLDSDSFLQAFYLPGGASNWTTVSLPRINELFLLSASEPDPDKRQVLIWEAGDVLRQGETSQLGIGWVDRYEQPTSHKIQNYRPPRTLTENFMYREIFWLADPSEFD